MYAHQIQKSPPALDYYAQRPFEIILQCHRVTDWIRSGAGPFRSLVLLHGAL